MEIIDEVRKNSAKIIKNNLTDHVVANPYLHFLSAHPNNLKRYRNLFDNRSIFPALLKALASQIKCAFNSIAAKDENYFGDTLPRKTDVLFISHFLANSDAQNGQDLYFGDLPSMLKKQNISSVTALLNHNKCRWRDIKGDWKVLSTPRVVLSNENSFAEELSFFKKLLWHCLSLKKASNISEREFLKHALPTAISAESNSSLRIARRVVEIIQRTNPKLLITTFEGHPWERLLYKAAKSINPDLRCIGYQHAVIFPLQDALSRKLGNGYDPDIILTAGDIGKSYLKNFEDYHASNIEVLGSARTPKISKTKIKQPNNGKTCIFLPEGIIAESNLMAKLAFEMATAQPEINFKIRLHPLVKKQELIDNFSRNDSLPPNLTYSNSSLEEDLENSRWAIYRGSSTIITAVISGAKPIYYSLETPSLSIDPLKDLHKWRCEINSVNTALLEIEKDQQISSSNRLKSWSLAQKFCRSYFTPFNPEVIVDKLR